MLGSVGNKPVPASKLCYRLVQGLSNIRTVNSVTPVAAQAYDSVAMAWLQPQCPTCQL